MGPKAFLFGLALLGVAASVQAQEQPVRVKVVAALAS